MGADKEERIMAKRATLYQDTVAQLLSEAQERGDQTFEMDEINKAIAERAKKIVRWEEKKPEKGG